MPSQVKEVQVMEGRRGEATAMQKKIRKMEVHITELRLGGSDAPTLRVPRQIEIDDELCGVVWWEGAKRFMAPVNIELAPASVAV